MSQCTYATPTFKTEALTLFTHLQLFKLTLKVKAMVYTMLAFSYWVCILRPHLLTILTLLLLYKCCRSLTNHNGVHIMLLVNSLEGRYTHTHTHTHTNTHIHTLMHAHVLNFQTKTAGAPGLPRYRAICI